MGTMTLKNFRVALADYTRAHEDATPAEPLHFSTEQWMTFMLERDWWQAIVIDVKDVHPPMICGLRVELHNDLSDAPRDARDSCPELWERGTA